tara:strand:- start:895 stop:1299 length:405 start_codon:yes stop_codon:yes gene_type:complete
MKRLILLLPLVILFIGCNEKIYTIDNLRQIGFKDSGDLSIAETTKFVGVYEYHISEGNAMEIIRRYPVSLEVVATKFQDTTSANEYHQNLRENPSGFYGAYYKCFVNNLYIGIKKDPNYSNYQKVCDFISIELK